VRVRSRRPKPQTEFCNVHPSKKNQARREAESHRAACLFVCSRPKTPNPRRRVAVSPQRWSAGVNPGDLPLCHDKQRHALQGGGGGCLQKGGGFVNE